MNCKLHYLCYFILLIISTGRSGHAYSQNIQFEQITEDIGLSQKQINCIFQDSHGFLWFGTKEGLNRFDGYYCKVYTFDPFDSTSLSNNFITDIIEDSLGQLWVGTENGLNLFRPEQENFHRFLPDTLAPSLITHPIVTEMAVGIQALWVATWGGGVIRIDLQEKINTTDDIPYYHFRHDPDDPNSITNNLIKHIAVDGNGDAWFNCGNLDLTSDLNRIVYDTITEAFEVIRLNELPENPFWVLGQHEGMQDGAYIFRVSEGQNGSIWIGTRQGLMKWTPKNESFEPYKILETNLLLSNAFWGDTRCITEDSRGRVWLGSFHGVKIFDPKSNEIFDFLNYSGQSNLLSQYGIDAIFEDRGGIIWLGSRGEGLFKFDSKNRRFSKLNQKNSLPGLWKGSSIRTIFEDSKGNLWIGPALGGLFVLDRKTGGLKPVPAMTDVHNLWNVVNGVVEDQFGTIWVATDPGLVAIKASGSPQESQTSYTLANEEGLFSVKWDILKGVDGLLWGLHGHQLYHLDPVSGEYQNFPIQQADAGTTENIRFPMLYQDIHRNIWIGTSRGLFRFNTEKKKVDKHYENDVNDPYSLSNNIIRCIHQDPLEPERYLWIATAGGGLNRLDVNAGTFTKVTTRDGLTDNVVYAILEDDDQNFWLSTNSGLSHFNLKEKTFKNYDEGDGLQDNEFNTGAYSKSQKGELFFGGIKGFNAFFSEEIVDNEYLPPVLITDFKLFNESFSPGYENSPLNQPIYLTDEIKLSHKQKMISFEFAAMDFTHPGKNEFWYKLENFDNEWRSNGTSRTATFTNLDPGKYTLQVRGTNNDGVYRQEGAAIRLIITPPWYQQWWAYLLFGGTFILLFVAFRKYELGRQRLKFDAEAGQQEAARLKELDEFKSRLYTNITHEFRTPLTVILGLSNEASQNQTLSNLPSIWDTIKRNAGNLLHLVNQMLDLSKLENKAMPLQYTQGDLIIFLRYACESYQSYANSRNISLLFKSSVSSFITNYDEDKLTKVLANLLANAIKFTPSGGKVYFIVERESLLTIQVKDTGIGIPEDQLSLIFDRFYQFNNTTTRSEEGTGIGLTLTKELVHLMGGTISVSSVIGEGTTFSVQLPFEEKPGLLDLDGKALTKTPQVLMPVETTGFISDKAIAKSENNELPLLLIIEDNSDIVEYLRLCLTPFYQLEYAYNGKVGLEKALEIVPDIIISDVMMPIMDGYQVCDQLKQDEKTSHIPIILLTAKATVSDRISGLKKGADAYLSKPFNKEELLVRLEKLLEIRQRLQTRYSHLDVPVTEPEQVTIIEDAFLIKARQVVLENLSNNQFTIDLFCREMAMSRMQLHRKLKALTDRSASNFIRTLRLQKAKELLLHPGLTVSEVAYDVGFNDPKYFSRVFSEEFGQSPSTFREAIL